MCVYLQKENMRYFLCLGLTYILVLFFRTKPKIGPLIPSVTNTQLLAKWYDTEKND